MHLMRWKPVAIAILFLLSLVASSPCFAQQGSFVQAGTVNQTGSTSLTYTCTFPQSNQAGNTLVLSGRFGVPATWTVTDSQGNPWVPVVNSAVGLWYAPNSKAGTNAVTITYSQLQPFQGVCAEYSGLFLVDQAAQVVSGTGTAATSSSISTTTGSDLIIGFGTNDTANGAGGVRSDLTAGTGFTLRGNVNAFLEDKVQSAVGSVSSSMTYGASVAWNQGVTAFSPKPPGFPIILTVNPAVGPVGTSVIVIGTNFGSTQGTSTIKFNGTTATVTSGNWTPTKITTTVPTGATTGNVVATVGGVSSNGVNYQVSPFLQAGTVNQTGSTSLTYSCTFPQATQAGNTLILAGRFGIPATWTVNDSQGNPWVPVVNSTVGLWYAPNSKAGTNTVTITYSQLQPFQGVCAEYSGLFALDQSTAIVSGTGTTATSSLITTTAVNDLIVGFGTNDTTNSEGGVRGDLTAGSGFTLRGNENIFIEDEVQGTAGPISSSVNYGASVVWNQGIAAFSPLPAGSPIITSLTPTSGPVGVSVAIAGTNFGSSQGTSSVNFNGVTAAVTPGSWTSTSMNTTVPAGATTGRVIVTVGNLPSNGVNFAVQGGGAITYIQSKTTAVATGGNNTATFATTPTAGNTVVAGLVCYGPSGCTVASITDAFNNTYTKIGPTASYGGPTNNITNVILYCASGIVSGSNFTVTAALSNTGGDSNLYIAEYSGVTCNVDQSASGSLTDGTGTTLLQTSSATTTNAADLLVAVAGSTTGGAVTAGSGYHLRQNGNNSGAEDGGFEDETVTATGPYSASMTVATNTTYWAMVMVALKGSSGSGAAPTVTSFNPTSGAAGASVTITGTNFTGATAVKFNATQASTFTVNSSTQIIATVPCGATTGTISVTTPSGTGTSSNSFTVTTSVCAITYIQSKTTAVATGGNNTATFATTPTAGNTVVAGLVCYGPSGCTVASITDAFNNTYTKIGPTASYGGPTNNITNVILYCASGIVSGSNFTVTAALSNTGGDSNLYIAEYSGVTCNVDQSASGSLTDGTGTTLLQTSSATTTNAADLLVAVAGSTTGGAVTAGSGYHLRQNGNNSGAEDGGFEDETVTATGPYSASMTVATNTTYWAMVMVALKGSSSGGTAPIITSLSAIGGSGGSSLTLTGSFGSVQGSVLFQNTDIGGSTSASITIWTATSIVVQVPPTLPIGLYNVQVVNSAGSSNLEPFWITGAGCPANW
jgi:uncharacterized membrane protein (UPF0136 family)